MNKVAHYLQQHLVGEVLVSPEVLNYFATDESVFSIQPLLVVHPRTENDVRKAARFSWQLAERGRKVPITIKGKGTDRTGAGLGNGIVLSTPAHLNKIIELDPKSGRVTVEAGTVVSKLQQTLHTHGRFLPATTTALEYSSIGGAVANNDAGPTSYKYGPLREFVRGLRVVLANGELIRTERLSKRELNKKLGLASFEGEVYRALDKLIEDSQDAIATHRQASDRSNAGYALGDVKLKDGSFDLTPLFVGSQGTLGLVTEITLDTEPFTPQTELVVALCSTRAAAWEAVQAINDIKDGPVSLDFIDKSLVQYVQSVNANLVKSTLENVVPETVLFIEIEKTTARGNKKLSKKTQKILETAGAEIIMPTESEKDSWHALRDSSSLFLSHSTGGGRAVPLVDDAVVPVANATAFMSKVEALFGSYGQKVYALWGQAGNGIIHAAPLFDVSQVGDRQKMFKMLDEFYSIVAEAGGSVSGETAEGRLRGTQVHKVMPPEVIEVMNKVKAIFDPHGTLNPGVKVGVDAETLKTQVRNTYSLDHQYSHLARS